jgi:hypothetical protein
MNPRVLAPLLVFTWLFGHSGVPPARAQTDNLDLAVAADYQYGLQARFTLTTDRPVQVQSAQLYFYMDDAPQLEHRSVDSASAGPTQNFEVVLDLGEVVLRPFSTVTYWWRIETSDGFTVFSPKASFFYFDNRKDWQILSDPPLEIRWTGTEAEWSDRILPRAHALLGSFEALVGLPIPEPVSIFLYPSQADLQEGLLVPVFSSDNDYSVPAAGVMLLAASDDLLAPTRLDRIVAQGLTEALLFDATRERYTNVPSWFREGLGMLMVPGFDPEADPSLAEAMGAGAVPLQKALCAGEPVVPSGENLRPVQAASLLKHALAEYGRDGVLRLLSAYADGAGCEKAFKLALGVTMSQLEMGWLGAAYPGAMVRRLAAQLSPWLLLLAPVLILVLASILPSRRGGRLRWRKPQWSRPYESPDKPPEDDTK